MKHSPSPIISYLNSRKKNILLFVICVILFVVAAVCAGHFEKTALISTEGQSYEQATVTQILQDNIQEDGNRYGSQTVVVRMRSGAYTGEEFEANSPSGTLFGADCTVGMKVIVIFSDSGDSQLVTVYSQDRSLAIPGFVLFFALIVCLIGGRRGVMAIASLAFTFLSVLYILFPLIYRGASPIGVTILVAMLVTLVTLGLLGGFTKKTAAAVCGTTLGVAIAGLSALAFGAAAGITGYNVSDIETLNYVGQYTNIRIGQLLFAGIILSSLGAVMDVGMSIASTIQEIHEQAPTLSPRQLFLSGIHVGRDMMGTMTNTLILAYVGSALSTLLIDYAYDLSVNQLLNSYVIGIEIMQGLSGSLGVVLTVPLTAFLATAFLTGKGLSGQRRGRAHS